MSNLRLAVVLWVASFVLGAVPASGVTWRVPADVATIEDAVDMAQPHDTVLVAPGEYEPSRTLLLDVPSVTVRSEVRRQAVIVNPDSFMKGLFRFESDSCVAEGFEIYCASWVTFDGSLDFGWLPSIDGNRIEDNYVYALRWTSGVLFEHGEGTLVLGNEFTNMYLAIWAGSSDALVEGNAIHEGANMGIGMPISGVARGNTIRGIQGYEDDGAPLFSGGINVLYAEGAVLVEENVLEENRSDRGDSGEDGRGGGILVLDSGNVTIRNNLIMRNQARHGAGIYASRSHVRIDGNLIWANHDTTDWEGEPRRGRGGGIYLHRCGGRIVGNTVAGNHATIEGTAVCFDTTSAIEVRNNIFTGNTGGGSGIFVAAPYEPAPYACNDAWHNGQQNYGGWADPTGFDGNISLDPVFCLPDTGNFALRDDSPCAAPNSPAGCGRIGAFDVGCGVNEIAVPWDGPAGSGISAIPNPARDKVWISWQDPGGVRAVVVRVIDSSGRVMRSWTVDAAKAGLLWDGCQEDGTRSPSGIYHIRLDTGAGTVARRIVLLR